MSLTEMEGADNEHEGNPDLKEKDAVVQTTITLEHLKTHPTELLTNANSIQKYMFLENVAKDSSHYTGKKFHHFMIFVTISAYFSFSQFK